MAVVGSSHSRPDALVHAVLYLRTRASARSRVARGSDAARNTVPGHCSCVGCLGRHSNGISPRDSCVSPSRSGSVRPPVNHNAVWLLRSSAAPAQSLWWLNLSRHIFRQLSVDYENKTVDNQEGHGPEERPP